jgi:hypothetical protein
MATITNTLIEGLTRSMVQARLNSADARQFTFGTHFPVKKVNGFSWETLQNQLGKKHVAADLHTDNGTVLRKRRPVFESAKGDVPYIAISREMNRKEIKDYQVARALAASKGADAAQLVNYWGNDVDFVWDGCNSEMEFIDWKLASNAGKLSFTTTNNATYANEFDLDYDVDDEAKVKTNSDWSNAASADILGDLRTIVKTAKNRNLNPKFFFINLEQLYEICSSEQIIKACASYLANATQMAQTPDLAQVNQMLARTAWLNGLQLRVIDQDITREFTDGTYTSGNPFENHRGILAEKEVLGSTQYDVLDTNENDAIVTHRSHVTVKKYSTVEPLTEVTIGECDAIPVLDTAYRNIYVRTDGQDWE